MYINYFKIFDLEEDYNINLVELDKKYLELQKKYHPDNYNPGDNKIKNMSFSIDINIAYKELKDNYKRLVHLIKINGINLDDDQGVRDILNIEELQEIFDQREKIEDTNIQSELDNILEIAKINYEDILKSAVTFFQKKNYINSAKSLLKLRYIKNLIGSVEEKLSKI